MVCPVMDDVENKIFQWAQQMPTLNTDPMALTARLQLFATEVNQALCDTLTTYKLTDASFDVLSALLRFGPPHSLSPSELLEQMQITSGTLTTRIDKLEKKGLVKRKVKKDDKRSVSVTLTKKGIKLIEEVILEYVKAQEKVISVLTAKEQQVFVGLLQKCLSQPANKKKNKKR